MAYLSQTEGQLGYSQLSVLVCGKTGIGKSTLINFIAGQDVCEVGDIGGFDTEPKTKDVKSYVVNLNGIRVIIFDSPGLQGGTGNDEDYLDEMYTKCRNVDLVFYCHDMLIARWTDHEVDTVRMLTAKFGPTFWNKAIFVLTKANALQPPKPMTKEEMRDYFQRSTDNSARRFRNEVKKQLEAVHARTDEQRIESIPAVPVGSNRVQILPNGKHFIENLWVRSSERITDQYLSNILRRAAKHPITQEMKSEEHWVSVNGSTYSVIRWLPVGVPVVGGAVIGAVVGTAASIPLAGTAIGLGLGAAIGAGIGGIRYYLMSNNRGERKRALL